jgi:hypothetical protein
MPEFYLKKYILEKFPRRPQRSPVLVEAIDYMVDQVSEIFYCSAMDEFVLIQMEY